MDDSKRCTATSRRTGKRCGLARIPGATVCATHGGSIGRVKEAAAARVADAKARELAARVDVDVTQYNGDPIEALRDLLRRDQAEMERFSRLSAKLEDDQLTYTTRGGAEALRAVLTAYQSERDALGRRLDLLLRAGVAQRMLQVRETQHQSGVAGAVALFGMCMNLFLGDVSSALASAGAYEQHNAVMEELRRRVKFRLDHERTQILTQIEILASKDSGPAGRNGEGPR